MNMFEDQNPLTTAPSTLSDSNNHLSDVYGLLPNPLMLREREGSLSNIEVDKDLGQGCYRDAIASASRNVTTSRDVTCNVSTSPENWLLQRQQQGSLSSESNNVEDIQIRERDSLTGMVAGEILTAQAAVQTAQDLLKNFATSPDFSTKMGVAFGNSFDANIASTLAQAWSVGNFSRFPAIAIRSSSEINGANGAFAAATNTIYLSQELVSQGDAGAIASVFLEEYGHNIDSQINTTDTPGDEGEIFSNLVQGNQLTLPELSTLKTEDDSVVLVLDGRVVAIEQKNQSDNLKFFAGGIKNWTDNPGKEYKITLIDEKIPAQPIQQNFDNGFVKYEFGLQSSLKSELFATPGNFGEAKFSYPVNINVELPNEIGNNKTSTFKVGNPQVSGALFNDINDGSTGFEIPNAGFKFALTLDDVKFKNIEIKTPFDEPIKLNGIDVGSTLSKTELNLDIASFLTGQINFDLLGGKISAKPPEIKSLSPGKIPETSGQLPVIAATGRSENVLNFGLDLDKILLSRFPVYLGLQKALLPTGIKLEGLGFSIQYPNTGEEEGKAQTAKDKADKSQENLQKQLELLKTIPPEGQQSALQETERLRQIAEQDRKEAEEAQKQVEEAKKAANSDRNNIALSGDILDIQANAGFALQQDFSFVPEKVNVTVSVDEGLVDGEKQSQVKSLGDSFAIAAPSEGSGVMKVKVKYELVGEVKNDIGLVLQGSIDGKALQIGGSITVAGTKFFENSFGPALSVKLPKDGLASPPFTLVGSDPDPIPFLSSDPTVDSRKIKTIKTSEIPGIEQDDRNPQADAKKNLIIEKEYKIPYNLAFSIADTQATEGNNPPPGAGKAYFQFDGKYYEWETYTVQSGDTLSQIALSRLGSASPNAYNFIAFQNNIPNPDLIFANTQVIQVPKQVQEVDTKGYVVFDVTQSGTPNAPAKIKFNTADGTATAGSDYISTSGNLSVPAGGSAVILVPIVGDTQKEETEQFTVVLTKQDGTPLVEGVNEIDATGTIIDDDQTPESPKDKGQTYNDPRIITLDKQYHDFQAAGEFTLVESTNGDLKIQVRQQALGNNPLSNVSDNSAVATVLGGKRIAIYKDRGLLIDGNPTNIANNDSIVIGDGRIYREGNIYTVVYATGDQLIAKVLSSRINISVALTKERQGKIVGLLGNFNGNPKDDLAKRDGTVISEPVPIGQLYGEYTDSWRISQGESLFDYKPGEDTNTFTNKNFPRQKVTLKDLNPVDIQKAEERIGNLITDPTIREAAIIDYILTGFDETIIEEAIASLTPQSVLIIAIPPRAFEDFGSTKVNIPVKIDVLGNDEGTIGVPLTITNFDQTTTKGGTIKLDDNATPDNKSDDQLIYTPPANFADTDNFNYTLSDGKETSTAKVTVLVNKPIPPSATEDFSSTSANTPVKIDVLANDIAVEGIAAIANFDQTTTKGGTIKLDDNATPDNKSDDQLIYTPAANFTGIDSFNYTLTEGKQTSSSKVTISVPVFNLNNLNGNNGFVINGNNPGNFSGVSTSSIGDFNGDGLDDLIIGAFGADPNNINAAGESYVLYGSKAGFPANITPANLNGNNGFIINGIDANGFSGGAVSSAGDINGDGLDDIAIGAFGATANGKNNAGKTYIVFGSKTPFPVRFNLSDLNGNNGFVLNGVNEFDYLGLSLGKLGDLNGDSLDDLLVNAPGPLNSSAGKNYIIYGRKGSFPASLNASDINGTNGFVINETDGNSGSSVSGIGDINGDGMADLIVGTDGANPDNNIPGKSYVVFGSRTGFSPVLNRAELNGKNGFVIEGIEINTSTVVSGAGDINGDGADDLIVGISQANANNNIAAGKTYIIFGSKTEFPAVLNLSQINGNNGFILNGIEPDERSGISVSAIGDINGDGFDDLTIGASGASVGSNNAAGRTYILFGTNKGFAANINYAELNGNNGFFLNGVAADDLSGTSVSGAGDLNGDGLDDVIIGSPGSLFNNAPGKSFVVFGNIAFGGIYRPTSTPADLQLIKTSSSTTPYIGDLVTFSLVVSNNGAGISRQIKVSDLLPPGMSLVSVSSEQGAYDSVTGIWDVGNLRDGISRTLNIVAKVDAIAPNTNTAAVTAARETDPDSIPNNNNPNEDDQDSVIFSVAGGGGLTLVFDEAYYLAQHPDVKAAVEKRKFKNGFSHFVRHGEKENRDFRVWVFDESYYLAQNPDVKAAVEKGKFRNGLRHFIQYGQFEARKPNAIEPSSKTLQFDEDYYLQQNPDVKKAVEKRKFRTGFAHFIEWGQIEGRKPSAADKNLLAG
jgi:uncharacterized repeat protein (TIGR01451 family)